MKSKIRDVVELVARHLPFLRAAYHERDKLREELNSRPSTDVDPSTLNRAPRTLHSVSAFSSPIAFSDDVVPSIRTLEERIEIALKCRDADHLDKVANAGQVVVQDDGTCIQTMYNGVKVLAGGYYGDWMQDLILRCKGHHEPQEEAIFSEILRHVSCTGTMIEIGGYWSFYSISFLLGSSGRMSFIVEPDPQHLAVGRKNAALNNCCPVFINASVGSSTSDSEPFETEKSGLLNLPCVSVPSLISGHKIEYLDILHCDAQGAELSILYSCEELLKSGMIGWVVVSTHSHYISNDPLTHQHCLSFLRQMGGTILGEHDVHESFSGDGLIVARFGDTPIDWTPPRLSFNRYSESLFRNPLYDLAALAKKPVPLHTAERRIDFGFFSTSGSLLKIIQDCPLGRAGSELLLPYDKVMSPIVLQDAGWQLEELRFLDQHVIASKRYVLLDIGANIGLFTRQAAMQFPNIDRFYCVEADYGNFGALQFNLNQLPKDACELWNVAMAEDDGDRYLYLDEDNFGNYSLNSDAMRNRPFRTASVKTVNTKRWMKESIDISKGDRIIWKSDTQGYDELIISLTPMDIWSKIEVAIVELWRIKKPSFDANAFRTRIDSFQHRSIGSNLVTTDQVLEYLAGDDWEHQDLYMWR